MTELAALLDIAWGLLVPGRLVALATVSARGAEARTVVLRGVERRASEVRLYTDALNPKVAQIAEHEGGTILVWVPERALQLRAEVTLATAPGSAADWAAMDPEARGNYGTLPAPGTGIPHAGAYERQADPARLTVISGRVTAMDLADLMPVPHRRARFEAADGWKGRWLAP